MTRNSSSEACLLGGKEGLSFTFNLGQYLGSRPLASFSAQFCVSGGQVSSKPRNATACRADANGQQCQRPAEE